MSTVSVVVGLTSGDTSDVRRCLRALAAQTIDLHEILVPYDEACANVTTLLAEFPDVHFVPAPGLDTRVARTGASREHHDTLRTIGLRAATGNILLMTEDHAVADPSWAVELVAALARHPDAGAMGGAVECDNASLLNWAVWFCDFGRYQNPLPEAPSPSASDTNVAYRAETLARVSGAWADAYREPAVHAALVAAGLPVYLAPHAVVRQVRRPQSLAHALRERFVWARSFAATRPLSPGSFRWTFALLTPLLPVVLTWRVGAVAYQRHRHVGAFLACAPLIALLNSVWAIGEFVGYVTGRPD